jgi:hypothetical protein
MIYDAFTYFNEIDLLRVRLVEHAPFVDRFVVVEGDRTFVGHQKSDFLNVDDPRIREFRDRITLVRVSLAESPVTPWDNELLQRNAIFDSVDYASDDRLLVSDLDEIVSRHHWPDLLKSRDYTPFTSLRLTACYYNINLLTPEFQARAKLFRVGPARSTGRTLHSMRMDDPIGDVPVVGFHFSFLGDVEFVKKKLASFSHQEYNNEHYNTPEKIQAAISSGVDLFGRFGKLTWVRVNDRWPLEMLRNPLWKRYIAKPSSYFDILADRFGGRRRRLP